MQDEIAMPEGYILVEGDCLSNGWHVLKDEGTQRLSLKNRSGSPKIFRTEKRAIAYAQAHASAKLNSSQSLPDWR